MQGARCAEPHVERLLHLLSPMLRRWLQRIAIRCSGQDPHRNRIGREHSIIGQQPRVGKRVHDEYVGGGRAQSLGNRSESIEEVASGDERSLQLGRGLKLCPRKGLMCDGQDRARVKAYAAGFPDCVMQP